MGGVFCDEMHLHRVFSDGRHRERGGVSVVKKIAEEYLVVRGIWDRDIW